MSIFNANMISGCIKKYIHSNSIRPAIVSFTLSFGYDPDSNRETPELLICIASKDDLSSWLEMPDAIDYVWNPAEYSAQEIEYKCVNSAVKLDPKLSREDYIARLQHIKDKIIDEVTKDVDCSCYSYVHNLDDHDFEAIISSNFNHDQLNKLKEIGIPTEQVNIE